jgi:hypothetical protein
VLRGDGGPFRSLMAAAAAAAAASRLSPSTAAKCAAASTAAAASACDRVHASAALRAKSVYRLLTYWCRVSSRTVVLVLVLGAFPCVFVLPFKS